MFDGLIAFGHSIWSFCDPLSLGLILLSSLVGVIIGALPGLTATMGVALMTTLTIKMPSNQALLVLICTYVGAIYGGSRSAILLNIPGHAGLGGVVPRRPRARQAGPCRPRDGHRDVRLGAGHADRHVLPRAVHADPRQPRAQVRLLRVLLAGALRRDHRRHADRRRPAEGLDRRASSASSPRRSARRRIYAYDRFSFGSRDLAGGFQLVPALVGAFGFAELLMAVRERPAPVKINPFDSVIPKLKDVTQYWRTILRSGCHRHVHRHPARRGRGRRGVVVVCRRQAREQGEGEVRQGLDRRADGGRDRRQRVRAGRRDSRADARHSGLRARRRADGGDADPRRAAGPDDHDRGADVRLRRRRDDDVRDDRHPDLRPHAHQAADQGADGAEADHPADHLRAVRRRLVRDLAAPVRRLGDAGLRRAGLRAAPDALSGGAAGAGDGARRPDGEGLPARARALRRRPHAVLHAADLRRDLDHDRAGRPAQVSGGRPRARPPDRQGRSACFLHPDRSRSPATWKPSVSA